MMVLFNVSREVAFQRRSGKLGEWQSGSPESVKAFSAACYYFGVDLQKELNVPVGLINSSYGGSQAEAWTPQEYLLASDDLRPCVERTKIWEAERPRAKAEFEEQMKQWDAVMQQAKASGSPAPRAPRASDALREYRIAASIYNGMIQPLIPFTIRGAIWYQGESNEERAQQYGILLPTMIRAWRERWGEGPIPFGIVQLPNYRKPQPEPVDEPWSFLREAQRLTVLNTPNTGLIVTIDIGEANNIHPRNKFDVGNRMYLWASANVYGRKILSSGPMFDTAKVKGSKIVLTFNSVGRGLRLRSGESKLGAFAIAGQDHHLRWAQARIKGKNKVEVWSDEIPHPEAVRYAFNNNPEHANLTNDSGLPAAPFRTDNWPGPTDGKR
jgi:sialate O-acetylesterase